MMKSKTKAEKMPDPTSRSATPRQGLPFEAPRTYAEEAVLRELRKESGNPKSHARKTGIRLCAIHAGELAERLTMPERLVRQCVANLVELGEPILSNGNGYWIAQTQEEFDECIASLMRRAAKIFKRAWRLKRGAPYDEMAGLLRLALLAPSKPQGEDVEEK